MNTKLIDTLGRVFARRWVRWGMLPLAGTAAVLGSVVGAGALPPLVRLAPEPLYIQGARAKPTLTLALSVEYPTVGAQYTKAPVGGVPVITDDSYDQAAKYIGYFDDEACYKYVDAPTETLPDTASLADYKRFDFDSDADRTVEKDENGVRISAHTCSGRGFSGNFMNWAASSAIDILRLGLSGGDRVIDTAISSGGAPSGFTVLQRAFLPTDMWNNSIFPAKKLKASLAANAVPPNLLKRTNGAAWAGDVWIASCANKLHFGTARAGTCSSPGANADLGVAVPGIALADLGSTQKYVGALPSDFEEVATEGKMFHIKDEMQVAFGNTNTYFIRTLGKGTYRCSRGVFGDPIAGGKRCYVREPRASSAVAGISGDGYFFSRVKVCDSSAGTLLDRRSSFCLAYPNGTYKPVGNLQKYSDVLRVSAFGYITDNRGNPYERYGGVLREPMKYVGQKYFDANFALQPDLNPNREWDPLTGQLIPDPDGPLNSSPRSGVINYLNEFGRAGTAPGVYKVYDPVGELYYEALRYLQGLPPTPASFSDSPTLVTEAMRGGFPVHTTWDDPHPMVNDLEDDDSKGTKNRYACIRNNIVLIGDTYTHNDKSVPGNPRTTNDSSRSSNLAQNEPDFYHWTKVVGAFETVQASQEYLDGDDRKQVVSNHNPSNTSLISPPMQDRNIGSDGAAHYIAGMAYWANTHDIRGKDWTADVRRQRPGMRVTTYVLDVNQEGKQTALSVHKNNQFFLAAKYGGFKDTTRTGNPFKVATADGAGTTPSNENWESKKLPGEASNYYILSSAQGVLDALADTFAKIATSANSIAGAAISTKVLSAEKSYIYQAQFDASDWRGDVTATPVSAEASKVVIGGTGAWTSVSQQMIKDGHEERNIVVGGGSSTTAAGVFRWDGLGTPPVYVQQAMKTPVGTSTASDTDEVGKQRLEYLRGNRELESLTSDYRVRGGPMGDIVNSGIVFSGKASSKLESRKDYAAISARKKALYVGANDGMLHAFDAASGTELFGYVPSWVVPRLVALTSPLYVHQSYVDATPVVADAKVGADWKTVLVSGTGGGGQGVFALDVTDPSAFDASKVLWEFTDADDADMGNIVGRPQLLQVRTTATGPVKGYAVFASGVNNHAPDGKASGSGAAAIFLLDLSKSQTASWRLGDNYFKIVFPNPTSTTQAAGMINFASRLDTEEKLQYLYAGDLQGKLWKLDFAKAAPSPQPGSGDYWNIDTLSSFVKSSKAVPMFDARDPTISSLGQPITMAPTLTYGADRNVIVSFGTGKYIEAVDIRETFRPQTVYALLDDGSTTVAASSTSAIDGRKSLMKGTGAAGVIKVDPFVWGRPSATSDPTTRAGWYFELPESFDDGERTVSDFVAVGNKLVFGSVIPSIDGCNDGRGKVYEVDIKTGDGEFKKTIGIAGQPLVVAIADPTDGLSVSDSTGRRVQKITYQKTVSSSGGPPVDMGNVTIAVTVGRLAWREMTNYKELKRTAK